MLARTAANATFGIYYRYLERAVLIGILGNHVDGADWAMSCAVTAAYTIGNNKAILPQPYGITN